MPLFKPRMPQPGEPLPEGYRMIELRGGQYDGAVIPHRVDCGHLCIEHGGLSPDAPPTDLFEVYIYRRGDVAEFFATATEEQLREAHRIAGTT